jgi:hypothetical protein
MSDVENWTGIGTAAAPFTGQFNGGKYEITNLKNTAVGLFGYCEGATIQNVVLGKGCSLYNDKEFSGLEGAFGGIVSVAKETKVTDCQFDGAMDFAGTNDNDEPAYIGGIVGALKGVDTNNRATVSNCTRSLANGQRIGDANFDSGYRGYISGIAGGSWSANITKCTNSAYMKNNAANAERVSGIVGIAAETTIDGCVLDADIENGACLAGICSGANSATLIIKNCKVNATLKSAKGTTCAAIAHNITTGLQILNCQIKGGYETASGSATWTGAEGDFYIAKKETDKNGNLVPVVITFTGNSLWK